MHFQVRTDNHIENSEALADWIRDQVEAALDGQFTGQIRRVEVYLQDVNGHKKGIDTRCTVEVDLAGHQPVVVHDIAPGLEAAVDAALGKMQRALEHTLDRLVDRRRRAVPPGEAVG
jgi:ribosome-associated translation inhibitor RaiA